MAQHRRLRILAGEAEIKSFLDNETTTDPTSGDDSNDGYAIGSVWINTTDDKSWICVDATVSAAVWKETSAGAGTGDVTGPASSTDNAIARFDGTTGKTIQDSAIIISDGDDISGVDNLDIDGYLHGRDFTEINVGLQGTFNDYALGVGTDTFRQTGTSGACTITGFVAPVSGANHEFCYYITGTQNTTFNNEDSGSSAANRILTHTGANVTFTPDQGCIFRYDSTDNRWRIIAVADTGGGGIGGSTGSTDNRVLRADGTGGSTLQNSLVGIDDNGDVTGVRRMDFDQTATFDAVYDNGNSGTAKTIDWNNGNLQKVTLTGNVTFTFTAPAGPGTFQLRLLQDATGLRTITWPSAVKWPNGVAPTHPLVASTYGWAIFTYDGTNYDGEIVGGLGGFS